MSEWVAYLILLIVLCFAAVCWNISRTPKRPSEPNSHERSAKEL